jgi:glyoxylate/hydroxypyruvate reductase A
VAIWAALRSTSSTPSPLWSHPKVLVTPHVASYCLPATAADGVVDNIRRARAGQPLRHQIDRTRGY